MIVRLHHLRLVRGFGRRRGFCHRGARSWFAAHGLDWNRFRREGIDAGTLLATQDPMAIALVEHARAAAADGQQ